MTKDDDRLDPLTYGVLPGGLTAPGENEMSTWSSRSTLLGKPVIDERPGAGAKVVGSVTGVTTDSASVTLDGDHGLTDSVDRLDLAEYDKLALAERNRRAYENRGEVEYDPKITGLIDHPIIVQHPTPASVWGGKAAAEIMADFSSIRSAYEQHGAVKRIIHREPVDFVARPETLFRIEYPVLFKLSDLPPSIRSTREPGWWPVGLARMKRTRSGRWRVCVATKQGGRTRVYRTKALALASVPRGPVQLTLLEQRAWDAREAHDRAVANLAMFGASTSLVYRVPTDQRVYVESETHVARGSRAFVRVEATDEHPDIGAFRSDDDGGKAVATEFMFGIDTNGVYVVGPSVVVVEVDDA